LADEKSGEVDPFARQPDEGVDQDIETFDRHEVSNEEHDGASHFEFSGQTDPCFISAAGVKQLRVNTIVDDPDTPCIRTQSKHPLHQIPTDGDNRVGLAQSLGSAARPPGIPREPEDVRPVDLDHHGEPRAMAELDGRPAIGVGPGGEDEVRAELSQGPPECRTDRVAEAMTVPAA
jgi:hypothetical protein